MRIQLIALIIFAVVSPAVVGKEFSVVEEPKGLTALINADQKTPPSVIDRTAENSLWSWFTTYMPGLPSWFNQDAIWDYVSSVRTMPNALWNYVSVLPGVGMATGAVNIVKEKLDESYAFAKSLSLPYASVITAAIMSGLAMIKDKGLDVAATVAHMFQTAYEWLHERYENVNKTQLIMAAATTALIALIAFGFATIAAPISAVPALSTAFVSQKSVNLFAGQLVQRTLSAITGPLLTGAASAC